MEPESNHKIYDNPREYLDQIASQKAPRSGLLDKKMLLLAGAVIILIIALVIWFAVSSAPKATPSYETLGIRLQNMTALLDYDDSKITDSKLKKAIAETKVIFASDSYQLSQSMTLKPSSAATTKEPITDKIAALDKAATTNNLNREYVGALNAQIDQIISSIKEVQTTSNNVAIEQSLLNLTELSSRLSGN